MKKTIGITEIHTIEIDLLKHFANICEQYNLGYYMMGGTLLGAVRHNGFIPWDNDVDVAMPRPDYDKFLGIFQESNQYKLLKIENKNNYTYSFCKIVDKRTRLIENLAHVKIDDLGVYIDVFPLDGFSNEADSQRDLKRIVNLRRRMRQVGYAYYIPDFSRGLAKMKRYMVGALFRLYGRERYVNKLSKKLRKIPFGSTRYIISTFGVYELDKEILKYEWFSDYVLLNFEGCRFRAPAGFDDILKHYYGDYMTFPPIDQRISHDIEVYLKDDD